MFNKRKLIIPLMGLVLAAHSLSVFAQDELDDVPMPESSIQPIPQAPGGPTVIDEGDADSMSDVDEYDG